MAELQPDRVRPVASRSVVLPVVPMFHAVGWGMPFAAPMVGVKLVFSASNERRILCELMNREKVTHTAGVPTVWLAMFQHIDAIGEQPDWHAQGCHDRRFGRAARDDRTAHEDTACGSLTPGA